MECSMIDPHSQPPHTPVQNCLGVVVDSVVGGVVGGRNQQHELRIPTRNVQEPVAELCLE